MNTPEQNKKNVKKLKLIQESGKTFNKSEDELRNENSSLENATREYPFATLRKFSWVACGGFWVFCLGGLLFGVDFSGLFPFLFFSIAMAVILQIPVFFIKRKIFDVVIGIICALVCVGIGISLFMR